MEQNDLMYTEADRVEAKRQLSRRRLLVYLPCGVALAVTIALFVILQQRRLDWSWALAAGLTILFGSLLIFFCGVYVRPMALYSKHIGYMLDGRKRETTGIFKSFDDAEDRDGLECHAMLLNVGDRDDPEDDRLFYYDAFKPKPDVALGERVTVFSNDKMVAGLIKA